uniref:Uncharacterized protein n=1 Tax=Anguilla anguilla TaxID=7936 RepID=A0A0E9UT22_ANGAN
MSPVGFIYLFSTALGCFFCQHLAKRICHFILITFKLLTLQSYCQLAPFLKIVYV